MMKLPNLPPRSIKPSGYVDFWDLGAADGPVKIERNPILTREALALDPDRYKLKLPNGTKPGPAQIAADKRAADEADEAQEIADQDPVYGTRRN